MISFLKEHSYFKLVFLKVSQTVCGLFCILRKKLRKFDYSRPSLPDMLLRKIQLTTDFSVLMAKLLWREDKNSNLTTSSCAKYSIYVSRSETPLQFLSTYCCFMNLGSEIVGEWKYKYSFRNYFNPLCIAWRPLMIVAHKRALLL